jgi:hypothetical protein
MNCKQARWLAGLEARGELPAAERDALRRHQAGCADCRAAAAAGERLDGALRAGLSSLPPTIDLRPAVMRQLGTLTPRGSPWRAWSQPWARPSLATAAIAVGALIAALLAWPRGHRTPSPAPHPQIVHHPPAPARPVGRALVLGSAILERNGQPALLGADRELRVGDRLRAAGRPLRIELADGSRVTLDRASAARLDANGLNLEAGRLLAAVTPQSRTFTVSTPQAKAEVLGTEFAVERTPLGSTLVTVERGLVRVSNSHGTQLVPAGSFTVARAAVAPTEPEPIDLAGLLAWAERHDQADAADETVPNAADLAADLESVRDEVAGRQRQLQLLRRQLEQLRQQAVRRTAPAGGDQP